MEHLDDPYDRTWDVATDTATLMLYDPTLFSKHIDEGDWWCEEDVLLEEARNGHLVPLLTGADGTYRVLLTPDAPQAPIQATFWFEVRSGRACMTSGERLPGWGDAGPAAHDPQSFPIPNGRYRVDIQTPASDLFYAPDYILSLAPLQDANPPAILTTHHHIAPAERPPFPQGDCATANRLLRKATKAWEARDLDGAIEAFDEALRADPCHREGLNDRSILKQERGDLEGALRDAVTATTYSPDFGIGWTCRSCYLLLLDRPEKALQAARRAVELNGLSAVAWNNLAEALEALGHGAEAVVYWQKALGLDQKLTAELRAEIQAKLAKYA